MSEERIEETIRVLMAKEIADDLCNPVEDAGERARCRTILFKILTMGSELKEELVRELQALSEETRAIIRRGLAEMGVGE